MTPAGPIRPSHATDGWQLQGDESEYWLTKDLRGGKQAWIKGTTPTCCAWRVAWRESSERNVDDAKLHADKFIAGSGLSADLDAAE